MKLLSLFALVVAAAVAVAGQGMEEYRCDSFDLTSSSISIIESTIQDIQSNYDASGSGEDAEACFPTQFPPDTVVKTTGVVTAVGRTSPPIFYMQAGNDPHSGIAVWDESHVGRVDIGDEVEVIGLVSDLPTYSISSMASSGSGMTTIEGCSVVVTSSGNDLPEPVVVDASVLNADACSAEAEQWESMLVTVENLEVAFCPNRLVGEEYEQCSSNIDVDDQSTWDKYYQSWMIPQGSSDDSIIIEIENHMFTYIAKCVATEGTPIDALTGVLVWESHHSGFEDRSSWDIVPRSIEDIGGCEEISTDDVVDATVTELQLKDEPFGPTEWGSVPDYRLSVDIGGESPFPGFSCPPPEYMLGANATVSRTHNLCSCFPGKYYDPGAGSQGSGTEYVRVMAIITHLQQGPFGPYYFAGVDENGDIECGPHSGMYTYRSDDPSGVPLAVGDMVEIIGRPYAYYGLEQLSDTLYLGVVSSGNPVCAPAELTAEPFGYDKGCNVDAEAFESRVSSIGPFTVVTVYNDMENPNTTIARSIGEYWQSAYCTSSTGDRLGTCMIEIEDAEGNRMQMDNKFGALAPFIEGVGLFAGEGRPLEVGDTCEGATGIIEWFRGAYGPTPFPNGGSYRFHPLSREALIGCSNGVDFNFN